MRGAAKQGQIEEVTRAKIAAAMRHGENIRSGGGRGTEGARGQRKVEEARKAEEGGGVEVKEEEEWVAKERMEGVQRQSSR